MVPNLLFDHLRVDHRKVLAQIGVLEAALGATGAAGELDQLLRDGVELLERQFKSHMNAEDDVIYPALAEALPEVHASLEPLRAEHAELRSMLAGLLWALGEPVSPDRDEQILVQVRDLVDLLRIHIRKEEALVFRVAEQVLPPRVLEALAARLGRGITPPTPDVPAPGFAKGTET